MKLLFGAAALLSAAQAFGHGNIFTYDWDLDANPVEVDGSHVDALDWLTSHVNTKEAHNHLVWDFSGDDCCMNGNRAIAGVLANRIDDLSRKRTDKEKKRLVNLIER